ncbi:MAG: hypothetical protein ACLFQL_01965 [Paracoccaceae bacterium]
MRRIAAFAIALVLALTTLTPEARADKASDCAAQGEVVAAVVAARQEGIAAEAAGSQLADTLEGRAADYAPALPLIIEWVYSLEADQLGSAVAESYEDACKAQ